MRCWVVIAIVAYGLSRAHPAAADTAQLLFDSATKKVAAQDYLGAVHDLETLQTEHPEHVLADDALFLAGSLYEERLAHPVEARRAYEALILQYPTSRSSLAASRRLAHLTAMLGDDNEGREAASAFADLLARYADRDAAGNLALARDIVRQHPEWNGLFRVHLWIAEAEQRRGKLDAAHAAYRAAEKAAPGPEEATEARLGLAMSLVFAGKLDDADAVLEHAAREGGLRSADEQGIAELRDLVETTRRRHAMLSIGWVAICTAVLAFLALLRSSTGSLRGSIKVLSRPSTEVVYMAPVSALLCAMAFSGHKEVGPAVAFMSLGGLAILWLSSAVLREGPVRASLVLAVSLLSTLATASLCYLAFYRSQLIDLILTTVRFGPE